MKNIFIPVKIRNEPEYDKVLELIKNIPEKNLAICYSNQFIDIASKIFEKLGDRAISKIQVLGCSNPKFSEKVDAILIVGQGKFHSVSLAYESKLPTYILENGKINKIKDEDIERLEKKEKGAYLKYLNSKKVGILITSKPGQEKFNHALRFKKNLKGKKGYLFVANDLNILEFENFGIDFWVNTACPRMDLNEAPLINLDKLEKLINSKS